MIVVARLATIAGRRRRVALAHSRFDIGLNSLTNRVRIPRSAYDADVSAVGMSIAWQAVQSANCGSSRCGPCENFVNGRGSLGAIVRSPIDRHDRPAALLDAVARAHSPGAVGFESSLNIAAAQRPLFQRLESSPAVPAKR